MDTSQEQIDPYAAVLHPAAGNDDQAALNLNDPGEEDDDDSFIAQRIHDDDETNAIFDRALCDPDPPGNDDDPEPADVGLDLAALDAEASELMRNPISKSCLKSYNSQNVLFVLYCWMHVKEALMGNGCADLDAVDIEFGAATEKKKQKLLRQAALMLLNGNSCPLHLHLITGQRFLRYLLSLCNSAGRRLSASAYSNKHAALFHLF